MTFALLYIGMLNEWNDPSIPLSVKTKVMKLTKFVTDKITRKFTFHYDSPTNKYSHDSHLWN